MEEPSSDFELIASLLPTYSAAQSTLESEEDEEAEDVLREATLLLFRLTYTQAQSQLESLEQELELLRSMPPPPLSSEDSRQRQANPKDQDDMWRLDAPRPTGGPDGKGPLLDPSGKVRVRYSCPDLSIDFPLASAAFHNSARRIQRSCEAAVSSISSRPPTSDDVH